MKKRLIIAVLVLLILIPLISANNHSITTPDLEKTKEDLINVGTGLNDATKKANPWNETIIISPTWQKVVGGFFGLNLHKESTEISVRETMVFFMVFVMFIVIILDILKLTPFFKAKLFGVIPTQFALAVVISTIVSITGAFINLKNLFVRAIAYTISSLDWAWLNFMVEHKFWGIILTIFIIIPLIIIIHEALSWIEPLIKKYSQVSRAEAKGRKLGDIIEQAEQANS